MRRLLIAFLAAAALLEVAARVLGRRPTRASTPPGRHVLVYDGDCSLCSFAAIGLQLRAANLELVTFRDLPRAGVLDSLDHDALLASAHYITPDGLEYHGGEAITRVLRLVPGTEGIGCLDWPVLRGAREIGYRLIAWQRGRVSKVLGVG